MVRFEFGSTNWAAAVCRLVEDLLRDQPLPAGPYSFSEEYTKPPLHLAGEALGWHLKIENGALVTGSGPLPDATFSITTEYDVVAPFVALSHREHPEAARLAQQAVSPAVKDGRFRAAGTPRPSDILPGFQRLHDQVADITLPWAGERE